MNTPFSSHPGATPFENAAFDNASFGAAPFGAAPGRFGFDRRHARRELREQVRAQAGGPQGPFGPGFGFGPSFGPGFGFGPGPRGGHRGRGGRGRGRRGDVRAAILALLTDRPMHGYEMTQEIAARSNDLWKPSPGSVYPTLQLLVDEGLIVPTESAGSKKTFELTEEGRAAAEKIETPPWEEIAGDADPNEMNLRAALGQLFGAVAQAAHAASDDQQQRILDIVNNARREVYQILGEE
ncbi:MULTISPECIES: PadR family transcriptional regulator [Mycobacteriaceae]|uniref:PadR family transcriptional regulator n=1 Tax=Mycolicibacterium neoaurum VKM Ac-1815D TaxID=700508 RepID=V5XI72_MYCNE|nr:MULTISPECIES: PadR family transcriptional regulator [Mycobacteriaceae]AHC27697.1 PadR family transcriptional regulator [Mycolicibacterium neoaurum VKM Ac-1815D]AMO07877.1 PadR family transcriptional regulator [Mycolicibacterium neoaurum]AXK77957.1 PadR family transcriptional regulator [Mycolicibacterium neoaurum]KJQ49706.1 PadR family transcriptional regulator [Mycolicibacterium neoaurum]KUM07206.1 PadR family transcriptional regulator [Mycolicibacterium neoaurum]